jgi:prefoldin subunit 5
MSKMTEAIKKLADNGSTVLVHIPGKGYVYGKVVSLDDDVVIIKPEEGNRIIIHYTQFSIERD